MQEMVPIAGARTTESIDSANYGSESADANRRQKTGAISSWERLGENISGARLNLSQ